MSNPSDSASDENGASGTFKTTDIGLIRQIGEGKPRSLRIDQNEPPKGDRAPSDPTAADGSAEPNAANPRLKANRPSTDSWERASDAFVGAYRDPLIAFLRRRVHLPGETSNHRMAAATDIVDSFLSSQFETLLRVPEAEDGQRRLDEGDQNEASEEPAMGAAVKKPRSVFEGFDPSRGSFHSYLIRALLNFAGNQDRAPRIGFIDPIDKGSASEAKTIVRTDEGEGPGGEQRERERRKIGSLDEPFDSESVTNSIGAQPDQAFLRPWAMIALLESLLEWRKQYEEQDPRLWSLFRKKTLEPFLTGKEKGYQEVYGECGFKTRRQAENAYTTFKGQFACCLRVVMGNRAATVADRARTEAERQKWMEDFIEEQMNDFGRLMGLELGPDGKRRKKPRPAKKRRRRESRAPGVEPPPVGERKWSPTGDSTMATEDREALQRFINDRLSPVSMSGVSEPLPDLADCNLYQLFCPLTENGPTSKELEEDLRRYFSQPLESVSTLREGSDLGGTSDVPGDSTKRSLGDSLHDPGIETRVWIEVKQWVKQEDGHKFRDMDVQRVIYLACIAAPLVHHGAAVLKPGKPQEERLTTKSWSELKRDFCWLAQQEWVDERTRTLADLALDRLTEA